MQPQNPPPPCNVLGRELSAVHLPPHSSNHRLSSSSVRDKCEGGSEKATVALKKSPPVSCVGGRISVVRCHYSMPPPLFTVEIRQV
ncbi:hypothetical protein Nepgr_004151 [Nepenthes gracilis]|uniref:Uncharacterized protein n=1 Tax=Nepenthes gracilis TaxID=150966 RepID=A0AAD3S0U3_NEPGR|nr:hypothetical protein Nepgr_004151 [Nepenthes gracilis]